MYLPFSTSEKVYAPFEFVLVSLTIAFVLAFNKYTFIPESKLSPSLLLPSLSLSSHAVPESIYVFFSSFPPFGSFVGAGPFFPVIVSGEDSDVFSTLLVETFTLFTIFVSFCTPSASPTIFNVNVSPAFNVGLRFTLFSAILLTIVSFPFCV